MSLTTWSSIPRGSTETSLWWDRPTASDSWSRELVKNLFFLTESLSIIATLECSIYFKRGPRIQRSVSAFFLQLLCPVQCKRGRQGNVFESRETLGGLNRKVLPLSMRPTLERVLVLFNSNHFFPCEIQAIFQSYKSYSIIRLITCKLSMILWPNYGFTAIGFCDPFILF